MSVRKRILCLANSRKPKGRCVAGVEIVGRKPADWIRPVSARSGKEVGLWEQRYENGGNPEVMDIIEIPFIRADPSGHQKENWLFDENCRWKKVGRAKQKHLKQIVSPHERLWINGCSSKRGKNDIVPYAHTKYLENSLRFICVKDLKLLVFEYFGKKTKAQFVHNGIEYVLSVTDPKYDAWACGKYEMGESYMTISLTGEFQDHVYKLVAAIIER